MLCGVKQKLDSCKELFLHVYFIDENKPSLTEIEAGVIKQGLGTLVYKAFLGLAPSYICKLIMRPPSAITVRPLRSLVRNNLLVPQYRTSISQQCACASAGPLLWNCLPVKSCAQILSRSLSSTPRLLKSFLFPGAYRTGGRL